MTQDGYREDLFQVSGLLLEAEHRGTILLNAVTPTPVLRAGVIRGLGATGGASAQGERDADHCYDGDAHRVPPFALTPHWFPPSTHGIGALDGASDATQNRCMRRPDGGTRSVPGKHDRSKR